MKGYPICGILKRSKVYAGFETRFPRVAAETLSDGSRFPDLPLTSKLQEVFGCLTSMSMPMGAR